MYSSALEENVVGGWGCCSCIGSKGTAAMNFNSGGCSGFRPSPVLSSTDSRRRDAAPLVDRLGESSQRKAKFAGKDQNSAAAAAT